METNKERLEAHFKRNEFMWNLWVKNGVTADTELTVNFQFYASNKKNMENLTLKLENDGLKYNVRQTKTMLFLKGWEIDTQVKQKWTLGLLQAKTNRMFLMAVQVGVSLDGCGALLPKQL
jgi:hypothetical protein